MEEKGMSLWTNCNTHWAI